MTIRYTHLTYICYHFNIDNELGVITMCLVKTELQEKDYPLALKIWERSVLATHHF